MSDTTTVLIVGAGFAGLGTAIQLLERGIEDFVILERAGEVGGLGATTPIPVPPAIFPRGRSPQDTMADKRRKFRPSNSPEVRQALMYFR